MARNKLLTEMTYTIVLFTRAGKFLMYTYVHNFTVQNFNYGSNLPACPQCRAV